MWAKDWLGSTEIQRIIRQPIMRSTHSNPEIRQTLPLWLPDLGDETSHR
jgi:hypothetical protein